MGPLSSIYPLSSSLTWEAILAKFPSTAPFYPAFTIWENLRWWQEAWSFSTTFPTANWLGLQPMKMRPSGTLPTSCGWILRSNLICFSADLQVKNVPWSWVGSDIDQQESKKRLHRGLLSCRKLIIRTRRSTIEASGPVTTSQTLEPIGTYRYTTGSNITWWSDGWTGLLSRKLRPLPSQSFLPS